MLQVEGELGSISACVWVLFFCVCLGVCKVVFRLQQQMIVSEEYCTLK